MQVTGDSQFAQLLGAVGPFLGSAFLSFSVASSKKAAGLVWWPVPAIALAAVGLVLLRKRFRLRLERR